MPTLRWTLVALLAASTILFGIGVIAERSGEEPHAEPAASQAEEPGEPGAGEHEEEGAEAGEEGGEPAAAEHDEEESETVLGIDVESTPLVVLAVLVGLGLAALAATRLGATRRFLLAVAALAPAWAVLDVREAIHLLDESRTGIALVALAVAVLHLAAAAVGGRLARSAAAS